MRPSGALTPVSRTEREDELTPRFDKHSKLGGDDGSETHQVFGTWSVRLSTDDGLALHLEGLQGFAQEARPRG